MRIWLNEHEETLAARDCARELRKRFGSSIALACRRCKSPHVAFESPLLGTSAATESTYYEVERPLDRTKHVGDFEGLLAVIGVGLMRSSSVF